MKIGVLLSKIQLSPVIWNQDAIYSRQQRGYPWCYRAVDLAVPVPNTVVKHRSTDSIVGAPP